ncbi:YhbY family RNA-binding protein [Clostridium sp. MD294]|uniref:YhbY family RNA-binding protein n=1 Tax=Clostridium sp. MD294 TaxID=97138 RepID=UPI0002CBBD76|nr:YhbY family RNA-binding protein [Clostridium sp. MD294]NDO46531.1 YhbY family RNA-binding protein [Clostridium sp. MD294]USF29039.1 RNA-binding protein YhbY [Clostridium sp. MD294]
MLTSKQRAYLKGMANGLDSIFQIGKSGITPELRDTVDKALEARELIKLNVLDNNMIEAKQAAGILADRTGAEVVQVIGNRFILFRQSKKKPVIELPK